MICDRAKALFQKKGGHLPDLTMKNRELIMNEKHDEERAFYGRSGLDVKNCTFDGPADGESAFKECNDITVESCTFNLRYPFWHDRGLTIRSSAMTPLCRAALWYTTDIDLSDAALHGIKALRECGGVKMKRCDVESAEFGWFTRGIEMEDCAVKGEYFMLRSERLDFEGVSLKGKYSFQYITDSTFENCNFDTKDAFWHAKNVTVRNSTVKGEYLAWYCENVTFENCVIIGTQPLCYCKGLKLINCEMHGADLSFEKSEVNATLTTPIISIKNAASGRISVPAVDEIIRDGEEARCEIIVGGNNA